MKTLLLALIMLIAVSAYSQNGIKGRVTDLQTDEPLAGAYVSAKGGSLKAKTNSEGEFTLSSDSKIESVTVTFIGYESQTVEVKGSKELLIQLLPTSISMNDVIVNAYESNRKLLEVGAPVALVTKDELERTSSVSLLPTLNSIPGVQMDQSHSEDARISIRGIGMRSSFGIRNLKIYLNDIPLTEANGFTRIEGIDVSTLGRLEIIKGPASSIYGAALGGVLNFQSERAPYNQQSVSEALLGGSYGLFRTNTYLNFSNNTSNIVATYGYQTLDGYRVWSSDKRKFLNFYAQFYPSTKQTLSVFANHSEQVARIPGELDSIQVAQDRTQADSLSLALHAGRNEKWTRAGVSHEYNFTKDFANVTSINLGFYSLDHPLPFAYIRGTYQSYGGRTYFTYTPKLGKTKSKFIVGGEYLTGLYLSKYYVNNGGTEGALWLDQETNCTQYSYYAQAELEFPGSYILTVGASNNSQDYKLKDLLRAYGVDNSGDKDFTPSVTPRIAFTKVFNEMFSAYGTISTAFAPPVDYELQLPSGGINNNLQAEKGINYELGSRGNLAQSKLHYDFSVYDMELKNELIPQTVGPYQVIYVNAGKTQHRGVELALSYAVINDEKSSVTLLRPYFNYTYSNFKFKEYTIDSNNYSGNKLTGVSPNVIDAGFDFKMKNGLSFNASIYYQDKFPMVDDNSKYNEGYSVIYAKIDYARQIKKFGFDVYAGVNNLGDSKYSSYIALNATANGPGTLPKFYNPSPTRNYYGGLSLKYIF